jgi:hypothetical protein
MYVSCSGNWGQRSTGDIYCDTTATVVTETELAQTMLAQNQLDNEDFVILLGAAVLMLVSAYGIRMVRRIFEDRPGRG